MAPQVTIFKRFPAYSALSQNLPEGCVWFQSMGRTTYNVFVNTFSGWQAY